MDGNWRDEVLRLTEDRDRLIEEVKAAMVERDQARTVARELRDLYAAEIDEGARAFPLPWEVDDDTGRNGRGE